MSRVAIIVEEDYKGELVRYALSSEDFARAFHDAYAPHYIGDSCSHTIRPLVHIWYAVTEVGSELWNDFFTNMQWGLSEGDIESGNLAYVDKQRCSEPLRELV